MGFKIEFTSDKTGSLEEARGSDRRLNVSSRSDSRSYYNSRDQELMFALTFEMAVPIATEYVAYWRNASPDKTLVISDVGVNVDTVVGARLKLNFVTGVAIEGAELTPVNMNKASSKAAPDDAVVMAMQGGTFATGIGGLTADGQIDFIAVELMGHGEFHLNDRVRLGQNDAIGIEVDELDGTAGDVWGAIFGYYE